MDRLIVLNFARTLLYWQVLEAISSLKYGILIIGLNYIIFMMMKVYLNLFNLCTIQILLYGEDQIKW